jgi:hypothetical protein
MPEFCDRALVKPHYIQAGRDGDSLTQLYGRAAWRLNIKEALGITLAVDSASTK